MAARVTPTVAVQILANTAQFGAALNNASTQLKNFQNNFTKLAGAIGVGFGTQEIARFAVDTAKLAGQVDSVTRAFDRLPNAVSVMNQLRISTNNTVSDLELMKTTVMATNFGIGLEKLPQLLQFATLRAQQTGQSVDYLVNSIVTGIGRKSPMILDNLGISLLRIREKLKGVGTEAASVADFTRIIGEIAEEELGKMPGFAQNAATQIDKLSAAWQNLKATIGANILQGDHYNDLVENLKNQLIVWNSSEVSFWTKLFSSAKEYQDIVRDIEKRQAAAAKAVQVRSQQDVDPITGMAPGGEKWTGRPKVVKTEEELKAEAKAYEDYVKKISDAFKRYGTSIKILTNASANDFARFENNFNKAFIHTIDRFKETGSFEVIGDSLKSFITDVNLLNNLTRVTEKNGEKIFIPFTPEELANASNTFKMFGIGIKEDLNTINESFSNAAKTGLTDFFMGFEQIAAGQISFGENILNAISSFMRSFGQQLIQLGVAKLKLDSLLTSIGIPNPAVAIAAIAAGTALMAASGAIRSQNNLAVQRTVRTTGGSPMGTRNMESMNIQVTGNLVGSGRDLVAVISNTSYDNKIRKGG